jgi:hypothetical protein
MRQVWPLALMLCANRVPIESAHFGGALTQAGSPNPRNVPALRRHALANSCSFLPADFYAAVGSNLGSLNRSPRTIIAQAMRAILLASATAATLTGLRSMIRASHSRLVPRWRAYRMTAMAPVISSHRKYRLPCFEIPPSLSLPPVECCLGTSPIQAAKLRPDENAFQSPTSATNAVATIGPMPGISSSRRLSSHDRCQPWICFSMTLISAVIFAYWRARASRLNRAATGMRSSRALARTSSSPAVPLRPFAEMMPSSAMMCARTRLYFD